MHTTHTYTHKCTCTSTHTYIHTHIEPKVNDNILYYVYNNIMIMQDELRDTKKVNTNIAKNKVAYHTNIMTL